MAISLFFMMIGLVCLLTIILLFCEYSCRGDGASKRQDDFEYDHNPVEDDRKESMANNNNSEEQSLVSTTASLHKLPRVSLPRRPSIKVLVRKESSCSNNVTSIQPV